MLGRRQSHPRPPDAAVVARDIRTFLRWPAAITAVGFLPFLVFLVMLRSDLELRDGVRAEGVVTEVLHVRKSSKGPPETSTLGVAFTTKVGEAVSAVLRTTRVQISEGDPVRLTYDSTKATRVRAVDGTEMAWRVPLIIAVSVWSFALVCLYLAAMLRLGKLPRSYLNSRPAKLAFMSGEGDSRAFRLAHLSALVRMNTFFGSLTVEPGKIVFLPEGHVNALLNLEAAKEISHTDRNVTVLWGRLLPPWLNTGIVLLDPRTLPHDGTAVVQLPGRHRRRLVIALQQAGFAVDEFRTWFSMGGHIGSRTELERFREHPSR